MLLASALFLAPLLQEQQIAVLRSGTRIAVPTGVSVAAGDRRVQTRYGSYDAALDPVVEVVDGAADLETLGPLQALDYPAWVQRVSERGFLDTLVEEQPKDGRQRALVLGVLEDWGRHIDPLPASVDYEDRVDALWQRLAEAEGNRVALECGRLLTEIGESSSNARRRIGLVDLRRALRGKDESLRWAATRVALHQREFDLQQNLFQTSVAEGSGLVRASAAEALHGLEEQDALGMWALQVFRAEKDAERIAAAGHLGEFGGAEPAVVKALVMALGASGYRAPGSYIFVGTQVSVVLDYDVEVALAAAIAKPRVGVLVEGSTLQVRVISTTLSRAIQGSLRKLTGANPGPTAKDWQDWYEAR